MRMNRKMKQVVASIVILGMTACDMTIAFASDGESDVQNTVNTSTDEYAYMDSQELNDMIREYDDSASYFSGAVIHSGEYTFICNNTEMTSDSQSQYDAVTNEMYGSIDVFRTFPGLDVEETHDGYIIKYNDIEVIIEDNSVSTIENGITKSSFMYSYQEDDTLIPIAGIAKELGYDIEQNSQVLSISREYQTKRVVVKSDEMPLDEDALAWAELYDNTYVFQYATEDDAKEACEYFLNEDCVEYAEPDIIFSCENALAYSDDSQINAAAAVNSSKVSWGVEAMNFAAYNAALGSNLSEVVVAVIDTGCDMDHPGLSGRLVGGDYNYSSTGTVGSAEDDHGHGTHVAGIVAACTTSNVKILPLKVMNSSGSGSSSVISQAIYKAIASGADVINMSLGGVGGSSYYSAAIKTAVENEVPVCVSSGNDTADADGYTPASVPEAFTIGSIGIDGDNTKISDFSNFGSCLDFAAPGKRILSTYLNGTYAYMSGTSMASPHAAAACAALKSYDNNMTVDNMYDIFINACIDYGDAGKDIYFGYGMIDMSQIAIKSEVTKSPVLSAESGSYDTPITVSISSESGSTVYYTTDGSVPSKTNGTKYASKIQIDKNTTLKAIAISSGKRISGVTTAEYLIAGTENEETFTVADGILTLYSGSNTEVVIPEEVEGQKITAISSNAFAGNTKIKSVVFNSYITSIPDNAFENCSSLKSVQSDKIISIGANAFSQCKMLSTAEFGDNLASIGISAFKNAASLTYINLHKVKRISANAFYDCTLLSKVDMPAAEYIDSSAYRYCDILRTINVTETLIKSIGDYAFEGDSLLQGSFNFVNMLTIGKYAFNGCQSITGISIPKVTTIKECAFQKCTHLEQINVENAAIIERYAFSIPDKYNCAIKSFTIDWTKVESIGDYAFQGWTGSVKLNLQLDSLTTLGKNAFLKNEAIVYINAPLLTTLSNEAFSNCHNLLNAEFKSVTEIGQYVFYNTANADILFGQDVTKSIGTGAFKLDDEYSYGTRTVYGRTASVLQKYCMDNSVNYLTTPAITYQPENLIILVGDSADDLSVTAVGFNLTYQWYSADNSDLSDAVPVSGATQSTYNPPSSALGSKYYYVIVSDGNSVTQSSASKVSVVSSEIYARNITLTVDGKQMDFGFSSKKYTYQIQLPYSGTNAVIDFTMEYPQDCIDVSDSDITWNGDVGTYNATVRNIYTDEELTYCFTLTKTLSKGTQNITGNREYRITYKGGSEALDVGLQTGDGELKYTSQNPDIVGVDQNGVITPVNTGVGYITVEATETGYYNANAITVAVTVMPASILEYSYRYDSDEYDYTGKSIAPAVWIDGLTKNKDYKVEYYNNVEAGNAKYIIKGINNYSGTITGYYTINKRETTITSKKSSYLVNATAAAFSLGAVSNSTETLKYTSSNINVAKVSSTGVVTLVGSGTAYISIKAEANNNCTYAAKSIFLDVRAVSQSITASGAYTKTYGNSPFALSAKTNGGGTLSYSSSNTSVAAVSTSGKVTIKGAGRATITVYAAATSKYKAASKKISILVKPGSISGLKETKAATNSLTFVWNKQAGVTGYQVYRYDTSTKKYKSLITIKGSSASNLTIKGAKATSSYIIKVRTFYKDGSTTYYGPFSSAFTVVARPGKVSGLKEAAAGTNSIKLSWNKVAGAEAYQIYRYNSSTKKYTYVGATKANSYTVKKLSAGTTYKYMVRAYKVSGGTKFTGANGSIVTMATKPAAVTVKSLTAVKAGFALKWNKVTCTGYQIQYSTNSKFKSAKTITVGSGTTARTITKLSRKKRYYVRIRAYKTIGKTKYYSSWSKTKYITTR